ncbi:hypothetical protein ACJX0J_032372, partial [Zea mays]
AATVAHVLNFCQILRILHSTFLGAYNRMFYFFPNIIQVADDFALLYPNKVEQLKRKKVPALKQGDRPGSPFLLLYFKKYIYSLLWYWGPYLLNSIHAHLPY